VVPARTSSGSVYTICFCEIRNALIVFSFISAFIFADLSAYVGKEAAMRSPCFSYAIGRVSKQLLVV